VWYTKYGKKLGTCLRVPSGDGIYLLFEDLLDDLPEFGERGGGCPELARPNVVGSMPWKLVELLTLETVLMA